MKTKAKPFVVQPHPDTTNNIVCFCRQVDRQTIRRAIDHGAISLESICKLTGAGAECGSCQVYIKEMLGENLWYPVVLASLHRYSNNYCAFRLKKADGSAWSSEMPGAYLIFQAHIDGDWVGRPYAITDDGAESGEREITVKRKDGGFFSNWLFDHLDTITRVPLRISTSMGGSTFNIDSSKPIICLVGGVGITPVLALCRIHAKNKHKPTIYIDYSAGTEEDLFCRDELQQLTQCCDLYIHFRKTGSQGRIKQADIDALIQQYPDEQFFICGPDKFKESVSELLSHGNVTPLQIIDLEASQTRTTEVPQQSTTPDSPWAYRIIGLLLLAAYAVQDAWGLKLPPLEQLQTQQNYKIFSGLLLLSYILMQWRLPMVRWLNLGNDKLTEKRGSHKSFGAIAPLVFYLHATSIGPAYLTVLSCVYLANSLLGFLNGEWIPDVYKKVYLFGWTVLHVGLSTSLLFLSGYHAYIAFAYK